MKKNRNIVELLQLLKNELINNNHFQDGLCFLVDEMYSNNLISSYEAARLMVYIDMHRPTFKPTHEDMYELGGTFSTISLERGLWGWYPGEKEQRLKWIDEQIKIEGNE